MVQLKISRCCRNIYGLIRALFKLFETQWPVIQGRWHPEAEFHQGFLA